MDLQEIRETLKQMYGGESYTKEADLKIVDWDKTYFLTKYYML